MKTSEQLKSEKGITWNDLPAIIRKKVCNSEDYDIIVKDTSVSVTPKDGKNIFCLGWFTDIAKEYDINCFVTMYGEERLSLVFH